MALLGVCAACGTVNAVDMYNTPENVREMAMIGRAILAVPRPEAKQRFLTARDCGCNKFCSNRSIKNTPMKTLEHYLKDEIANKQAIDFRVRAEVDQDGIVSFYIHPLGVNGETADYVVNGNELTPPKCGIVGGTTDGLVTAVCQQPRGHTGKHGGMGCEWNDAACVPSQNNQILPQTGRV